MELTKKLASSGPDIYSTATDDFVKMISENDKKSFDRLKKENFMLRTALKELQNMMVDVVNMRKEISKQRLESVEFDEDLNFRHVKDELFNIQGTPLSTNTLMDIRNNITKFKSFCQKFDEMKLKVFQNSENLSEFQNFSNLPKSDQISMNALIDMVKNSSYVMEKQEELLKRAVKKVKAKKTGGVDIVEMKRNLEKIESDLGNHRDNFNNTRNQLEFVSKQQLSLENLIQDVFERVDNKRNEVQRKREKVQMEKKELEREQSVST